MRLSFSSVLRTALPVAVILTSGTAFSAPSLDSVRQLAGCYITDYSYSETRTIDPDYTLDPRVYDVRGMTVKEWIDVVDEDASSVRIQRFMQADALTGGTVFMMRHHGEIWKEAPTWRYRYTGRFGDADKWDIETLDPGSGKWVREITNLDDGLRYQCLGSWKEEQSFSRFTCDAFAPIPGRETRDMGRRDYNTMQRSAEVTLYGESWLERQANTKVVFEDGARRPLVEEVGKIWQVRIPDEKCGAVQEWAAERQAFWDILAEVWRDAHDGVRPFHEIKTVDGSTRGDKISELMAEYFSTVSSNPRHAQLVRLRLADIIEVHRE